MARNIRFLILSVVVLTVLSACNNGGSYSNPTAPPSTNPPTAADAITIVGQKGSSSFSPNPASAKVGTTVQWKNSDSTTHHIVSDTGGAFDTGNIGAGASSGAMMVNTTGTYPYHCTIHPSMVGTLNVTQ